MALFFAGLLLVVNLVVLATQRGPIVRELEAARVARGRELVANLAARASRVRDAPARRDLLESFLEFEDVERAELVAGPRPGDPQGERPLVRTGAQGWDFFARVPGSDAQAHVRLGRASLTRTVHSIGSTIAGIAAAAVGTGFLLVFLGSSIFTRPVLALADLARRIRGGELGAQAGLERRDELGELAGAMDSMSAALAEQDAGLRSARDELARQNEALRRQGAELSARTRQLSTLLESIREGVLFFAPDRRLAVCNRAAGRILGLEVARALGQPLAALALRKADEPLRAIIRSVFERAGRGQKPRLEQLRRDHLHAATTVEDEQGNTLGVLAVVTDYSRVRALEAEQKELLDQLFQQEKMAIVGLLAASVAHELNTPLGTILLHTRGMARELPGGGAGTPLEVVAGEVHRCREIVRRLLDFSRAAESRPVRVQLAGPIERCAALAEAGFRRKGITIERSYSPDLPEVPADPNQVEQVVLNLISNAADAMPEGGPVSIRVGPAEGGVEVVVRDRGPGVPPAERERVFEPFVTTKPRERGTGLGLAICRRIMDEHHGRIELGGADGGGAEVRLFFPAAQGADD